jgi:hypothetical protein
MLPRVVIVINRYGTTAIMITIVSGLPRSGTSMMMRILEAGGLPVLVDDARPADADNPNGYYEFEPVKSTRENPSWLSQADGRGVKMVYQLLYDLPPDRSYRVIFMQRALKEIVASQNKMLSRLGRENMGGPTDEHTLVASFAAEIAKAKAWLRERPNFQTLFVNYNRLLDDPAPILSAVNQFCGDALDETAMRKVVDPSLYRQRT